MCLNLLSVVLMSGTDVAAEKDKTKAACMTFMLNRKAGALLVLGQESPHELAMFQESVSVVDLHGKIADVVARM